MTETPPKSEADRTIDEDGPWKGLYLAIGRAIVGWSILEHALARAFAMVLNQPSKATNSIFFSSLTFNGRHDMLIAALKSNTASDELTIKRHEFFKAACRKARRHYAPVRNKLAHDQPGFVTFIGLPLVAVLSPNVPIDDMEALAPELLTAPAINQSARSFRKLAGLVQQACSATDCASLDKLLQQVRELPHCPYSHRIPVRTTAKS